MLRKELKTGSADTKYKYILSLSKPQILLDSTNLNSLSDSDNIRNTLVNKTNFSLKSIRTHRNYTKRHFKHHEDNPIKYSKIIAAKTEKPLF